MTIESNYLAKNGEECPRCLSSNIESGPVQIDSGIASANSTCNECCTSWVDEYKLVAIHNIEIEEG